MNWSDRVASLILASKPVKAVLFLLAGVFLLDLMGVFVKMLLVRFNASELSFYRNAIGMLPAAAMLYFMGGRRFRGKFRVIRQWPLALSRGFMSAFAQLFFYLALARMEFATVATILFSMSLFIVAFSVPLLGAKVGPVRWLAVIVGFVGVIMVVGPGSDAFTLAAILPLAAAALYALNSIVTRMIDDDVPSSLIYLYSAFAAALGASALTALGGGGFTTITSAFDLGLIWLMGLIGGSGVICLVVAFRMADPSLLAPFNYFGILSAFVLGWLFFQEAPFERLLPGVVLILAGGLLVIWRERRAENISR